MTLYSLYELLTWSRVFGYGTLFFAISFLVDFARQPTYPKHIPMLGHGRGWWAKVRNSFSYISNYHKWLNEGYEKVCSSQSSAPLEID
jgi:hypothetical protein